MKNDRANAGKTLKEKQKIIGIIAVATIALTVLITVFLNATDHRGELRQALESRDSFHLEQLLKKHPKLVHAELPNRSKKDTWTALHWAACFGNNQTIEILLSHKAKINARDANGLTPLHYTVALSRHNSAQLLINKGADMNATGKDGRTPLELAKTTRDKRMIELFRVRGAKE